MEIHLVTSFGLKRWKYLPEIAKEFCSRFGNMKWMNEFVRIIATISPTPLTHLGKRTLKKNQTWPLISTLIGYPNESFERVTPTHHSRPVVRSKTPPKREFSHLNFYRYWHIKFSLIATFHNHTRNWSYSRGHHPRITIPETLYSLYHHVACWKKCVEFSICRY